MAREKEVSISDIRDKIKENREKHDQFLRDQSSQKDSRLVKDHCSEVDSDDEPIRKRVRRKMRKPDPR